MQHNIHYLFLKKIVVTTLFILFLSNGIAFAGIRCGNDIISIKDSRTIVISKLQSCGKTLNKDTYTKEIEKQSDESEEAKTIKVQKRIDLWSIRIKEKGNNYYCYPLTFEDGLLVEIGRWSRCD